MDSPSAVRIRYTKTKVRPAPAACWSNPTSGTPSRRFMALVNDPPSLRPRQPLKLTATPEAAAAASRAGVKLALENSVKRKNPTNAVCEQRRSTEPSRKSSARPCLQRTRKNHPMRSRGYRLSGPHECGLNLDWIDAAETTSASVRKAYLEALDGT
ncbi:hypothetical protein T484DRAFT_1754830 [Baffinella frigidus]|nr:hypothetical protein T484DRAFT_1754830 [Cryptophyta sp. CCMP2293]